MPKLLPRPQIEAAYPSQAPSTSAHEGMTGQHVGAYRNQAWEDAAGRTHPRNWLVTMDVSLLGAGYWSSPPKEVYGGAGTGKAFWF